ncbi:MAG: RRXRR domain-containing protein [Kiritimatiellae bacterium]|nr:RRXRR domain-containing protein [Kiritimatiellia bacterium]
MASKTYVPVLSSDREVLMPTTAARARKWVKSGKATPFFRGQMFCVRMNVPTGKVVQPIAVGIDPGSKWEGYTVKSESHTYLNIQADAVTWVKDAVEVRRNMRKARRSRKTPYRANRKNRARGCLPPSTKARWQWKLRVASWLCKLFPVDCFVVEDIKAKTKGRPKWDKAFSPLEIGKTWFYAELGKLAWVETLSGYDTFTIRNQYGLKKGSDKKKQAFESHCVDSWVLANWFVGGHITPDNERLMLVTPLQFHRRQLHVLQPTKGGARKPYGSTCSLGFKRGSLVLHPKWGITYVGGTSNNRISLHSLETGKRLTQKAKELDCRFVTYNTWRTALPVPSKAGSLRAGTV